MVPKLNAQCSSINRKLELIIPEIYCYVPCGKVSEILLCITFTSGCGMLLCVLERDCKKTDGGVVAALHPILLVLK